MPVVSCPTDRERCRYGVPNDSLSVRNPSQIGDLLSRFCPFYGYHFIVVRIKISRLVDAIHVCKMIGNERPDALFNDSAVAENKVTQRCIKIIEIAYILKGCPGEICSCIRIVEKILIAIDQSVVRNTLKVSECLGNIVDDKSFAVGKILNLFLVGSERKAEKRNPQAPLPIAGISSFCDLFTMSQYTPFR